MKIQLTQRDRFGLYIHLNNLTLANHSEERKFGRLWEAFKLDETLAKVDLGVGKVNDYDNLVKEEFELGSGERDYALDVLDRPKIAWVSRIVYPIALALRKSREGDDAKP